MESAVLAGSTSFQGSFWEGREASVIFFGLYWMDIPYPMTTPQVLAPSSWDLQPLFDTECCRWLFLLCLSSPGWVPAADFLQRRPQAQFVTTGDIHGANTRVLNRINCSVLPSCNLSNYGLSWNFSLRNWVWCSKEGALHHGHVRSHLMAVHGYLPTIRGHRLSSKGEGCVEKVGRELCFSSEVAVNLCVHDRGIGIFCLGRNPQGSPKSSSWSYRGQSQESHHVPSMLDHKSPSGALAQSINAGPARDLGIVRVLVQEQPENHGWHLPGAPAGPVAAPGMDCAVGWKTALLILMSPTYSQGTSMHFDFD